MTFDEETYLLDSIKQLRQVVMENSRLLHQIVDVVNVYLANHQKENKDDFGRNILANLISGAIDLRNARR